MVKPWDAKPGKIYNPNKRPEDVEKGMEKRRKFNENWDLAFGKRKLNNQEDNSDETKGETDD